jgi:hypothetical protein
MGAPTIIKDWEEFKRWCWWWPQIQNWIDTELPTGYRFTEAFDVNRDCRKYMLTFKPWDPFKDPVYNIFDYTTGTLVVS